MAAIQLVVCDMAGTTIQDRANVHDAFISALGKGGVSITREDANRVMGHRKPDAIRQLITENEGKAPDRFRVSELHQHFVQEMVDFYTNDPDFGPMPGAEAAFEKLHARGILVALNTGFSRPIANAILKRLGWQEGKTIDLSVTSDEVANGRPAPDMTFECMNRLRVMQSKHVAKVGDTPSDLGEGTNAGCAYVIGVTSGAYTAEALQTYQHTHILGSIAEVPDVILAA